jgi:hypothetical protein
MRAEEGSKEGSGEHIEGCIEVSPPSQRWRGYGNRSLESTPSIFSCLGFIMLQYALHAACRMWFKLSQGFWLPSLVQSL